MHCVERNDTALIVEISQADCFLRHHCEAGRLCAEIMVRAALDGTDVESVKSRCVFKGWTDRRADWAQHAH